MTIYTLPLLSNFKLQDKMTIPGSNCAADSPRDWRHWSGPCGER